MGEALSIAGAISTIIVGAMLFEARHESSHVERRNGSPSFFDGSRSAIRRCSSSVARRCATRYFAIRLRVSCQTKAAGRPNDSTEVAAALRACMTMT